MILAPAISGTFYELVVVRVGRDRMKRACNVDAGARPAQVVHDSLDTVFGETEGAAKFLGKFGCHLVAIDCFDDLAACKQQATIRFAAPQKAGDPDVGIENDTFGHRYASCSSVSTRRSRSSSESEFQFNPRSAQSSRMCCSP